MEHRNSVPRLSGSLSWNRFDYHRPRRAHAVDIDMKPRRRHRANGSTVDAWSSHLAFYQGVGIRTRTAVLARAEYMSHRAYPNGQQNDEHAKRHCECDAA
jgi:hypothetical protein